MCNKLICSLLFAFFIIINVSITQAVYITEAPTSIENQMTDEMLPQINLPALNYQKLIAQDEKEKKEGLPYRFGYVHDVNIDMQEDFLWDTLSNDMRVGRVKISAPSATTINLNYSAFDINTKTRLYVYGQSKEDFIGPFTYKNIKENKEFATGLIKDSICYVEIIEPINHSKKNRVVINGIVHGYRSVRGKVNSLLKAFQDSGSCNYDVGCGIANGWSDQIKSVALILTGNNNRICTGALINNTSQNCQPYFLTAEHCFSNRNPGDVLNNIFMFNYDSPTPACPGTPVMDGPTTQTVQGATVVAEGFDSDFFLLQLTTNPLDFYDVYYAGWNRANSGVTDTRAIHHPAGDVKKFSVDNDPPAGNDNFRGSPIGSHWRVVWEQGTTEGGSSGSPIFDQNKRIIGDLSGGTASCSNPNGPDVYGKIWYSWDQNGSANNARLRPWLDPTNSNVMFVDGTNCSSACPPDYAGPNTLTGNQNTSADFETDGILQSTQLINADVDYDSGTHIDLLPGFEVSSGNIFEAFIDGCGNLRIQQDEVIREKRK